METKHFIPFLPARHRHSGHRSPPAGRHRRLGIELLEDRRLLAASDVNNDGIVDIFDINLVSAHWGETGPEGDANADGNVDIFDINLISSHWGEDTAPPGPFDVVAMGGQPAPLVTGFINVNAPMIDWSDAAGADHYTLQVFTDPLGANPQSQSYEQLLSSDFTLPSALSDGPWRVRATAFDLAGNSTMNTSGEMALGIDTAPPEAFSIVLIDGQSISLPIYERIVHTDKPVLDWTDAPGAASYSVEVVAQDWYGATNIVYRRYEHVATSELSIPDSLPDSNYAEYWSIRVTAYDLAGNLTTASNTDVPFEVDATTPASFQILSGLGEFSEHLSNVADPLVSWTAFPSAASYVLEFSHDLLRQSVFQRHEGIAGLSFQVTDPLADGEYNFHAFVTAFDAFGNEMGVAYWPCRFDNVAPLPCTVVSINGQPPGSDITSSPDITVVWEPSGPNFAYFTIKVSQDSECDAIARIYQDIVGTSWTIPGVPNGIWHICITQRDEIDNTSVPAFSNFNLDVPFYYIFSTSTMYQGTQLTSRADMDYEVTLHAYLGDLIPEWDGVSAIYHAILSIDGVSARDALNALPGLNNQATIFNVNNQFVAYHAFDLFSAVLHAPAFYNENAFNIGSAPVWTGTNADGTIGQTANDWTNASGLATAGRADRVDDGFLAFNTIQASLTARLYAIGPIYPPGWPFSSSAIAAASESVVTSPSGDAPPLDLMMGPLAAALIDNVAGASAGGWWSNDFRPLIRLGLIDATRPRWNGPGGDVRSAAVTSDGRGASSGQREWCFARLDDRKNGPIRRVERVAAAPDEFFERLGHEPGPSEEFAGVAQWTNEWFADYATEAFAPLSEGLRRGVPKNSTRLHQLAAGR